MLCQEIIWITEKTNTYCMRRKGHSGKCNTVDEEPKEDDKKDSQPLTREVQ